MATAQYTVLEEKLHAWSHGLPAITAVGAFAALLIKATGTLAVTSVVIYGTAMIAMLGFSSLYHLKYASPHAGLYKLLDHIAIYLMIAGSYTPFALLGLPGSFSVKVMIFAWGVAGIGIFFKIYAYKRGKSKALSYLSLASYLGMSWAAVLTLPDMMDTLPQQAITWLAIGGGFYTFGAIFYALKQYRYTHFIWHLFVLGGAISHYISIYLYVL